MWLLNLLPGRGSYHVSLDNSSPVDVTGNCICSRYDVQGMTSTSANNLVQVSTNCLDSSRTEPQAPSNNKKTVFIQIVFIKLGEIETVKETFTADVLIQARWREPQFDGRHTASVTNPEEIEWSQYWSPLIYVDNTIGDPKESVCRSLLYDVTRWEAYFVERRRVKGPFLENLELFHFPFDTQDLTVKIASQRGEDEISLEDDELKRSTINVQSFVDEQEWRLYDEVDTFRGSVSKYFQGDNVDNSVHQTFSCRTHATRRAGFYITNIFVVMIFICSMTFSTFSVDLLKPQNRLQLTFILLLTTVTFKFAVNSSLPRISYLTALDVYIIASMTIVIMVGVWHAIVPAILFKWGNEVAGYCDSVAGATLGIAYIVSNVMFVAVIATRAIRRKRYYEEKERIHKKLLKKDRNQDHEDCSVSVNSGVTNEGLRGGLYDI